MPITHLFAEGIGPFKRIHLDLRGADGDPALGPHILAGVNGSGKSTVLKAIAWCLAEQGDEFQWRSGFISCADTRSLGSCWCLMSLESIAARAQSQAPRIQ